MKTYILILSSIFVLASCGSTKGGTDTPNNTNPVTPNTSQKSSSDGAPSLDPRTVESAAVTSESSTGASVRPR